MPTMADAVSTNDGVHHSTSRCRTRVGVDWDTGDWREASRVVRRTPDELHGGVPTHSDELHGCTPIYWKHAGGGGKTQDPKHENLLETCGWWRKDPGSETLKMASNNWLRETKQPRRDAFDIFRVNHELWETKNIHKSIGNP